MRSGDMLDLTDTIGEGAPVLLYGQRLDRITKEQENEDDDDLWFNSILGLLFVIFMVGTAVMIMTGGE